MRPSLVRSLWLATCTSAALTLAVACGSFSSDTPASTDGGPDATAPEGGGPTADGSLDAAEGGALADRTALPFEIAAGLEDLAGIAVTDTMVYVAEHTKGNVLAISINGGAVATLSPKTGSPIGLAVGGSSLFWSDLGGGRILRAPLVGGAVTASPITLGRPSVALAPAANRIITAAVDIGGTGEVQQYGFDLSTSAPVTGLKNPWDVAVDGAITYWTESAAGRIGSGTTKDTTNVPYRTGESDCRSIAADGAGVYWARPTDGLIRATLTGSAGVVTVASGESGAHSLTTDGQSLYWLRGDGELRRCPRAAGASVVTLAAGGAQPFAEPHVRALAVNATYVVWVTTNGRVLRLPK